VNFTEIKPEKYNHKCLLVLVDTFSGIDRSFPHQMRDGLCNHQEDTGRNLPPIWNAQGNLVRQRPYFRCQGKPGCGQVFIGQLEITLYLQTSKFRTGRVNNKILKETLTRLNWPWRLAETGWHSFPLALFRARNTPSRFSLTPFEILYGALAPLTVLDDVTEPTCHSSIVIIICVPG